MKLHALAGAGVRARPQIAHHHLVALRDGVLHLDPQIREQPLHLPHHNPVGLPIGGGAPGAVMVDEILGEVAVDGAEVLFVHEILEMADDKAGVPLDFAVLHGRLHWFIARSPVPPDISNNPGRYRISPG